MLGNQAASPRQAWPERQAGPETQAGPQTQVWPESLLYAKLHLKPREILSPLPNRPEPRW